MKCKTYLEILSTLKQSEKPKLVQALVKDTKLNYNRMLHLSKMLNSTQTRIKEIQDILKAHNNNYRDVEITKELTEELTQLESAAVKIKKLTLQLWKL